MGCSDRRPAPTDGWARASARLALVAVVGWALASTPIAASIAHLHGHDHTAGTVPVEPGGVAAHHAHGDDARPTASDEPTHDPSPDLGHCLACLVGTWALSTPTHVDAAPLHTVGTEQPSVALVASEHHRHVRSRAPPSVSVAL